jgi:hypothetical protein
MMLLEICQSETGVRKSLFILATIVAFCPVGNVGKAQALIKQKVLVAYLPHT